MSLRRRLSGWMCSALLLTTASIGEAQTGREKVAPGKVFRDCPECPEMVMIPGGEYRMGSASWLARASATAPRRVKLPPFALGRYEVSQEEWEAIMGSNPSVFASCGPQCPVESVSWAEAKSYVSRLNERVSGGPDGPYRLPSEAEWEYACRGGMKGHGFCGGNDVEAVGWYGRNSDGKTHPRGMKSANGYGLHDMSGNVEEWVEDCWNDSYEGAPQDGSAWTTGDCGFRVLRGGSWISEADHLRWASRSTDGSSRGILSGLRLARTLR